MGERWISGSTLFRLILYAKINNIRQHIFAGPIFAPAELNTGVKALFHVWRNDIDLALDVHLASRIYLDLPAGMDLDSDYLRFRLPAGMDLNSGLFFVALASFQATGGY